MKPRHLVPWSLVLMTACQPAPPPPAAEPGVSRALAEHRARTLGEVRYDLTFAVPEAVGEPIRGRQTVRFARTADAGALVLDFAAPPANVVAVRTAAAGSEPAAVPFEVVNGHLVVAAEALKVGENVLEIDFLAGDGSLNRNPGFLYTLFVPDRAHHAFPCFDQPDLKARFRLTLELPAGWQAVANGPFAERRPVAAPVAGGRAAWTFGETPPLPTYLFSFAAGEFEVEEAERDGRTLRFFHRETDADKLARNREALFDLHAAALAWLEDYTAIEYPFEKFDFVLVPAFQYGGMEHPGAILYRDASVLLEPSATQRQLLGRASLIAHETAHMWFGDLVTMEWFDDVWLKEVFANFMAAKIVNPSFPEIDHPLRFLLNHFPAAYEIDRSQGTHTIRQPLDNLLEAGSLYGALIYQKAPIVMRHLEERVGEEALRDGLREYLGQFRFGNASWHDLIAVLDRQAGGRRPGGRRPGGQDLAAWSHAWVGEAGRPTIRTALALDGGRIASLALTQVDPQGRSRRWPQRLRVVVGSSGAARRFDVDLADETVEVAAARGLPAPDYVLPDGAGLGYGRFALDGRTRAFLLERLSDLEVPLERGFAWLALWDELLEGRVTPGEWIAAALAVLDRESDPLLVARVLDDLGSAWWRFLPDAERHGLAPRLETLLWRLLEAAHETTLKSSYFRALTSVTLTADGVERLTRIWRRELEVAGLPLAEDDFRNLALELAVREVPGADAILAEQLERTTNPDRRQSLAFVTPALSADPAVRDAFFESLRDPANREHEPWVLEALAYLHHPLRAAAAEDYVLPSLELVEEIQRTGDIFFPKRWLDVTLGGHGSPAVAATVRDFLAARPDYPPRLRGKILQAADMLFRAEAIR